MQNNKSVCLKSNVAERRQQKYFGYTHNLSDGEKHTVISKHLI